MMCGSCGNEMTPLEVRQLRARVAVLEAALEKIANEACCDSSMALCCDGHESIARAALSKGAKYFDRWASGDWGKG